MGVKWVGREADNSPPSTAEVKNPWSYTSTPQYAFMAWYSDKAQGELYLYYLPPLLASVCTVNRLDPLTYSKPDLTLETTNQFRHFGKVP
jgi:hypothetical protein